MVIPGLEFREFVLEIYLGIINGKKPRGQNDAASHFPVLRGGSPARLLGLVCLAWAQFPGVSLSTSASSVHGHLR